MKSCLRQVCYEIYFSLFTVVLFYIMAGFYNISPQEFQSKVEMSIGASYTDYELTLNQRNKLSKMYHYLCLKNGLKRDFNTDYIVLKALKKYHIQNTHIPLYESRLNKLYFYHQNQYVVLEAKT